MQDEKKEYKRYADTRFNTEILDFIITRNGEKIQAKDITLKTIAQSQVGYWLQRLRQEKDHGRPFLKNYHYQELTNQITKRPYHVYWYQE